ncbi:hypothetical protein OROMI_016068 [Orobanche minor]
MKTKALKPCKQIHALTLTKHIDMNVLSLSSKLIGAYACCGDLTSSQLLLQEAPRPNVFALNWMILTLTSSGYHQEAFRYFSLCQESRNNISSPNKYTFSAILRGCVGLLDLDIGKQVHAVIYKMGFQRYITVANALIRMYGKCLNICNARHLFDRMTERDVASWTTMICGYADAGEIEESVVLFGRMRVEGVKPNEFTWNAIIAGHARNEDCDGAFRFFSLMGEEGFVPDLATWNALISGYVQSQRAMEALEFLRDMLISGIKPNQVTLTAVLPACGMIASIGTGKEIHGLLYRMDLDINVFVASALIDMYSKCGSIKNARHVFNTTTNKNTASWNAMIGCYGKHGMVDCAIELFKKMHCEKIQPNGVTFTSVLSACSHGGLVEKGLEIFKSMESYGVKANKEHYSCLIDVLCRYGRIEDAYDFVKQIGVEIANSTIGAFLNGCKIHERRDLAENIYKHLGTEMKKPGGFVTLSNIYASEGKWGGVEDVRKVMKENKVLKKPGFSLV